MAKAKAPSVAMVIKKFSSKTTLKNVFKAVYGTSLAAHIKEHRLLQAAELLCHSQDSMAEIAAKVGYESQSRFLQLSKNVSVNYLRNIGKHIRKKPILHHRA